MRHLYTTRYFSLQLELSIKITRTFLRFSNSAHQTLKREFIIHDPQKIKDINTATRMQNLKTLNRALQRFVIDPRWIPFSSPLRDHNITSQCSQANCNSCTRRARCGVQRAMLATRADTTRSFCIARRFHLPPPSFQGCIERQRERGHFWTRVHGKSTRRASKGCFYEATV